MSLRPPQAFRHLLITFKRGLSDQTVLNDMQVLSLALLFVAFMSESSEALMQPSRTLKGLVDTVVDTSGQAIATATGICEDVSHLLATLHVFFACT